MTTLVLLNPPWHLLDPGQELPSALDAIADGYAPLELLYGQALREVQQPAAGETVVIDAHRERLDWERVLARVADAHPSLLLLTTAPGYAAWRVPPTELSLPQLLVAQLRRLLPEGTPILACGPHGSSTPQEVLQTLSVDGVIRGEPEEVIARLDVAAWASDGAVLSKGQHAWNVDKAAIPLEDLPVLNYRDYPLGPQMDVEWSRGCSFKCTFCNRLDYRYVYRERPIEAVLAEVSALKARGVEHLRFIDDLFGLGRTPDLLMALRMARTPGFSIQTRVDLWDEQGLNFLASAGCTRVTFGLESPIEGIQKAFQREDRYALRRTEDVLTRAVQRIPEVHVTLMHPIDLPVGVPATSWLEETLAFRERLQALGCQVPLPVTVFPYPGTVLYKQQITAKPLPLKDPWKKAQKYYVSSVLGPDVGGVEGAPALALEPSERQSETTKIISPMANVVWDNP